MSGLEAENAVERAGSRPARTRRFGLVGVVVAFVLGGTVAVGANVIAQADESDIRTPPSVIVAMKGQRAFDSRTRFPDRPPEEHKLSNRDISTRTFTVPVGGFVPPEAVGVVYSVTVTATEGSGYVSVDTYDEFAEVPEDVAEISTAAWTESGQRVVNSGIVKTYETATRGAPLIRVGLGGAPDAAAHVIIDITGYLLPAD